MSFFVPLCFEFGSDRNPCRCRILGPTLGFVAMILVAIIAWPAGVIVMCCNRDQANKLFGAPAEANGQVGNLIPF
ncbi:hypothetical protein BCR37DRAFT_377458 [Protomyces lactucae-debilis]|uniref:Uncharacterized protein n=1 Tax=Protomyces lactucae-debilis TaxID=2754530 RepID=A0A1Y2FP21_PROLT|nr:uncharacterized protein BCR37DRAFT_377458 [Protomyces lactucae-debilis]ORY85750.1 hypothetical protein BCR37DRAFT_377458 [Protomyces lactucae-debilis]